MMNSQFMLAIGGVAVIIMMVVLVMYWQRQGVVKRKTPTTDTSTIQSEIVDWLSGEDAPTPVSDWGDGSGLSLDQVMQINAKIVAKRKIEAIKLYREFTGLGLKEAKDAVEAIERGQRPSFSGYQSPATNRLGGDIMTQIEQELRAKRKINAIKLYREAHNVSLKEAKDTIDEMERQLGLR